MAYLFDTDAVSETLRREPLPLYLQWLGELPRAEQYTSAVVVGELYKGAYRSSARGRHLRNIDEIVRPALTVLPYDVPVAREFGRIRAALEERGQVLPDSDLQIAATALHHGLELVTGNLRHFERVPDLRIESILDRARCRGG